MTHEWQTAEHSATYLQRAERVPHRAAGEATLIEELPARVRRVLDLGSGDGRLLGLILAASPGAQGIAVDFSPPMLDALRARFGTTSGVGIVDHNLELPLPPLGTFDVVVSSFAIHHVVHERKRALYREVWSVLEPGGVFCNLEHVESPSPASHALFLKAMGISPADEDPSNKLLDVQTQVDWLREIGFSDVDCYWKWRELALLVGRKGT